MVSENKKKLVQEIVDQIKSSPIVGVVNMASLPAQQLQNMRATLRKSGVKIQMARKKLLQLAFEQSGKENIQQLKDKITGMPALIFTESNPFALYSTLQKNKSEAPAREGQIAPKDIIVKAGATNFAPGPIISELAAVGIKTKVEGGKLAIVNDVIVAKDGDVISAKLAETLKRLDIKPMEVGLDLVAVWEDGLVYNAKQLHVDEAEYTANFTQAATWAFNLAIEAAYPTADTTEVLLQKAFREAKAVGVEQCILTVETRDEILAKAEAQAHSVKTEAKIE
ncbi:50S ribosomal protein L10 [Candidatus Woesearchaeota archaeon]|nr:50S ribosomal protein L10 [Candidatus Woesearchaeota archaeon]